MLAHTAYAQNARTRIAALHTIGVRTFKAIATSDSAYISSIVDPDGIAVGADSNKRPVTSFRADLQKHNGVYCELFQKGCTSSHNPDYTLGHSLTRAPRQADVKFKMEGNSGTIEYWEFGGKGDLIASFSYRYTGGRWYLCDIRFV